jgi:putative hemolysin
MNNILEKYGNKTGYDFVSAVIEDFNVTTTYHGIGNLPEKGRFIFVSNHPMGGFDGMLLIRMIFEKYGDTKSISNDILMNIKNMNTIFLPINKHGSQSSSVAENFDKIMRSGSQILTFPAGLVSRKRKGVIRDVDWKKSFISKAIQYKRDVIPVFISGRCTNFFYNLANLRKFLGIKSNIEMFYLADETYRHRNEHVDITIGPPVSWQTFDKPRKPLEWALLMQDYVYSLAGNENKPFSPDE